MPHTKELLENFRFLILETTKQVEDTLKFIEKPGRRLQENIAARDDYIDNLKNVITSKCFSQIECSGESEEQKLSQARSIDVITGNLEHIADFCVNVVGQMGYLTRKDFIQRFDYLPIFREILGSLKVIEQAFQERDISLALQICKSEFEIDQHYKKVFHHILGELRGSEDPGNLVTTLFIFRYLERMGDALLNIGEAVISAVVGEKLKIHQYEAIEESLEPTWEDAEERPFSYRAIAETQSRCRVGVVHYRNLSPNARGVIFKEGRTRKIVREKESIEMWERIAPGMIPRIFGFQEQGEDSYILLEFLAGSTFQEILLTENTPVVESALGEILSTLEDLWERTLIRQPARAGFLAQLRTRLDDVLKVHPRFKGIDRSICDLRVHSLDLLLREAEEAEKALEAPFSVLIHGDLNNDNVIYNRCENRVYFIDLYRSNYSDYLQDLSVFMVSNFRLPVFETKLRERINQVNLACLSFFREFAKRQKDVLCEVRLALGLARSFMTSTRFELDRDFSEAMFLRSVYLMSKVIESSEIQHQDFRLPEDVLIY